MSVLLAIMGWTVIIMIYAAGIYYFRQRRAWLGYYLFAAFGLTIILVFGARWIGLAGYFESLVTYSTTLFASAFGITAKWLGQSQFMVMEKSGWIVLQTNIECSALIESSILAGLILFYPTFDWKRKMTYLSIGLIVTIAANALRMLIIAGMVAALGRGAIFIGHAVVGRLFFFVAVISLYWFILTRPTVIEVGNMVEEA